MERLIHYKGMMTKQSDLDHLMIYFQLSYKPAV